MSRNQRRLPVLVSVGTRRWRQVRTAAPFGGRGRVPVWGLFPRHPRHRLSRAAAWARDPHGSAVPPNATLSCGQRGRRQGGRQCC